MYLQKTKNLDIVDMGNISPYLVTARQSIKKEYNNNVIFKYSPNQKYVRIYSDDRGIDKYINNGYLKIRSFDINNTYKRRPIWPMEINDLCYTYYNSMIDNSKLFVIKKALVNSFKYFDINLLTEDFNRMYFVKIDNLHKIIASVNIFEYSSTIQIFSQRPLDIMNEDVEKYIMEAYNCNRLDKYPEHLKTASDLFTSMDELSKLYNVELTKDTLHNIFIQKLIEELSEYIRFEFKYRDITNNEQKELDNLALHFSDQNWIDNGKSLYLETLFDIQQSKDETIDISANRFTVEFKRQHGIDDNRRS